MELSGECGEEGTLEEHGSCQGDANTQNALHDQGCRNRGQVLSVCGKRHPPLPVRCPEGMTREQGSSWLSIARQERVERCPE